jgi:hypothetical protein
MFACVIPRIVRLQVNFQVMITLSNSVILSLCIGAYMKDEERSVMTLLALCLDRDRSRKVVCEDCFLLVKLLIRDFNLLIIDF